MDGGLDKCWWVISFVTLVAKCDNSGSNKFGSQASESKVHSRRENLKALKVQAEKFDSAKHFMAEELEHRLSAVQQR